LQRPGFPSKESVAGETAVAVETSLPDAVVSENDTGVSAEVVPSKVILPRVNQDFSQITVEAEFDVDDIRPLESNNESVFKEGGTLDDVEEEEEQDDEPSAVETEGKTGTPAVVDSSSNLVVCTNGKEKRSLKRKQDVVVSPDKALKRLKSSEVVGKKKGVVKKGRSVEKEPECVATSSGTFVVSEDLSDCKLCLFNISN